MNNVATQLKYMPLKQRNHKYINRSIEQWLDIHYGDTSFNGRVVIGRRKHGGGIYTMSVRSLTELRPYVMMIHASQRLDYYITANTVSGVNRLETDLFGLQNIVIDIDCHDDTRTRELPQLVEAFIWRLKRDLIETEEIPSPNSIVRSGRGVQLWWALKPCYGGSDYKTSRYHYDKIKNNLMDHIEAMIEDYSDELCGLEVDRGASSNPVGYFRLPCTYNTTAKRYGELEILQSKRYDQRDLTKLDSPEVTISRTNKTQYIPMQDSDRIVLQNYHSAGLRRVMQLVNLRNLRNNDVGSEMRDYFNFSVYNALRMSYDHKQAMVRLRAFNAGFKMPMSPRELDNCISAAVRLGGYKYSNDKLIELLSITPEEQDAIGLYSFRSKRRTWALSKPNASRDTARKALKEDRDNKILSLYGQGVSQAEIARTLCISKNTVGKVVKESRTADAIPTPIIVREERPNFGAIYVLSTITRTTGVSSGEEQSQTERSVGGLFVMPRGKPS